MTKNPSAKPETHNLGGPGNGLVLLHRETRVNLQMIPSFSFLSHHPLNRMRD